MIYTLGYAGRRLDDVVRLAGELAALVVDVRIVPASRMPGFSLADLQEALPGRYVWLKGFGNANYRGGPVALANFEEAAAELRQRLGDGPGNVMLLCGCRDAASCHRKVVAERLAAEWGAAVAHLEPPAGAGPGPGGGGRRLRRVVPPGNRYRVGLICRPEREHSFQLRIVDRQTGAVERQVLHEVQDCTRRGRRQAEGRAAALEADLNAGRVSRMEVASWAAFESEYLADLGRRCRRRSVTEARSVLRLFQKHRQPDTVLAVTQVDVERFLVSRPEACRATQNKYLRTLAAAFEWAKSKGLLPQNPAAKVKPAKVDRTAPRVLADAHDRERLLAALGQVGAEWETAARLILATGLRMGEISHLTWRSINLAERWLLVQPEPDGGGSLLADWSRTWAPKNHSLGILALDGDLTGALTERKARSRYDLVGAGLEGAQGDQLVAFDVSRGMSVRVFGRANPDGWARDFRKTLSAACKAEGLPEIHPHDLRRTFATMLARQGLDPLALKTVMRHSRIQTTEQFYIEIDREAAATRARDALGGRRTGKKYAKSMPSTKPDEKQGKA